MHTGLGLQRGIVRQPKPAKGCPTPGHIFNHDGFVNPQAYALVNRTHIAACYAGLGANVQIAIIGNGGIGLIPIVRPNGLRYRFQRGAVRYEDPAKLDATPQISVHGLLLQELYDHAFLQGANSGGTGRGFFPHI